MFKLTKKILFVFGTRPEAIKMAPVIEKLKKDKHFKIVVVVTAQHREMLDQVLKIFKIIPDHDLGVMVQRQTLSHLTIKIIERFEKILDQEKPDLIMVQGDTTTTFASSLVSFYHRVPIAHLEAGLRTYDKFNPFPEEINRQLTSLVSDLHFAPTQQARKNLLQMGIRGDKIFVTGNTVIDALLKVAKNSKPVNCPKWEKDKKLVLVTVHRRESFGNPLIEICEAVNEFAGRNKEVRIVIPVHKNPKVYKTVYSILGKNESISLIPPMEYEPFVYLMNSAYFILTDSGGIQEEAPSLGKPVLVLRDVTERPEGVKAGTVKLIGTKKKNILSAAEELLKNRKIYKQMSKAVNPYGDGLASERIRQALLYNFGFRKKPPESFTIKW
jgi:UDP-N-acetylglucosamine 2-epimerase (non-hydrolysing)